jgi:beta-xylosidase
MALLLAACGGRPASAPTPATPTAVGASPAVAASTAITGTASASLPTQDAPMYTNPVINEDFPDPDLLKVGDTYYAYATNFGTTNIQTAQSTDLVEWTRGKDALPVLPLWSNPGLTWAPDANTFDGGESFVMYFTARDAASDKQCIGLATSDAPEGPFRDPGDAPFICTPEVGGAIDASSFIDDDGTPYLLWKNDGNCCGMDTWIHIQPLAPDGRSLVGTPTQLIQQDQGWEGNLVEAPTLWKHEGTYYLFYSANSYAGDRYAVGYATAPAPTGPYTKAAGPWLATSTEQGLVLGPGGQDIVVGPSGRTYLVYHSWDKNVHYRRMNLDELRWENGLPVVRATADLPQPMP